MMTHQSQAKPASKDQSQPVAPVKYPELSDAELEIVCGGGNLIGRKR
jgi:hypothetical protein